jgi:feruloyl esterase
MKLWHAAAFLLSAAPTAFALLPVGATAASPACDSLSKIAFADASVEKVDGVAAGDLTVTPVGPGTRPQTFKGLPAFCRVVAILKPTLDSDIKVEVWLPGANWNGKYQAVGNGGWAGFISYGAMADALRNGYATSSTDTGHVGANGKFVPGHPEKLIDFGYRSEHEMTLHAKAIIARFYGNAPRLSYWNGCSTGGRQGLMEATRYPNDFDGIIAGDPANPRARMITGILLIAQAIHKDKASYIPESKYPAIHKAAVAACDALDGVKDGLIENPKACQFDPKVLACTGADSDSCLTAPQVEMARKITSAAKYSNGKEFWPGFEPGSELGWSAEAGPEPADFQVDHFKYVVFKDPNWDFRSINPDTDVARAEKADGGTIDVTTADLSAFTRRNGKLILYHGWTDQLVAPQATIDYFKRIQDSTQKASESVRLFMVPGMNHCTGGEGPNLFDMVSALDQWVDKNKAPEQIVASHSTAEKVDRTRPLCSYPQVAKYKGTGSIDEATSFVCTAP